MSPATRAAILLKKKRETKKMKGREKQIMENKDNRLFEKKE
jgi:hypothetical protein